ncbi:Rrf2 family transcriptional regulator [Flammeovirga yaeyamensis]|uniref:Rrf2 family transcriptional regulator n=1 Tax=Flammeovirga yaeyamensis TaxID=367791 RepID=A0AAX1NAV2_9BACT|nr:MULTISPECIES: Rrf2 family transcriptional regulator [Flammeovirga]ANQ49122.1 Rrf2 family transcriptional regulator [Flammeovirga sp. MY04]MBB3698015.1 Rrf2 family protein [Flammeovirga yaeyamensis]NMF35633.1 Rrf2 family transcriptional regulator [Flammeovirga yaeyamensis]QWG03410.1 Rrf2 family transcriptional regulator [Flammeovirga yaeyamensis]
MLSKKTKYALKALRFLASKYGDGPVLISDIAKKENISQKFLESILLELRKGRILSSKKGKGGGYYLIKDPQEVTLCDIHRMIEGPIAPLPCVSLNYYEPCEDCEDEVNCTLKAVMLDVRDAQLEILKKKTILDLLPENYIV